MTDTIKEQIIDRELLLEHLAWCQFSHDCHEAVLELTSEE